MNQESRNNQTAELVQYVNDNVVDPKIKVRLLNAIGYQHHLITEAFIQIHHNVQNIESPFQYKK